MATVAEQRKLNKHGKHGIKEVEFIQMRDARDATLGEPKLIHPSLMTNIRAGKSIQPESDRQLPG